MGTVGRVVIMWEANWFLMRVVNESIVRQFELVVFVFFITLFSLQKHGQKILIHGLSVDRTR